MTDGGDGRPAPAQGSGAYPAGTSPFRPDEAEPLLERTLPVAADLRGYGRGTLRRDLLAGVTVAALALPSAMGFAEVAGLPPVSGLYALLLPCLAYAALGSSKRLVIGPEGTSAAMTGAALAPIIADDPSRAVGAAGSLAALVGIIFLLARLLRLGWIADYFSRPVLVGYIHGVAIVLVAGQLGKLTGIDIEADDPIPQVAELVRELDDSSATTTALGVSTLVGLLVLRWRAPKIPGALVAVVAGIAFSALFDFEDHGIAVLGDIPSGLPSLSLPDLRVDELDTLLPAALGIFTVSFADSILTARSYAGRHRERVRANQELLAFGVVSLAASASGAFPVSGSGSRTAVADGMGVRTQVATLIATGTAAVVLLVLTAPLEQLPTTVLAAVIISAAIGLISIGDWRALLRTRRRELIIAIVTFLGVVVVGILQALIVAVILSILDVVVRSARPHDAVLGYVPRLDRWGDVSLHPSAQVEPGVVVYRLDDRLFYANADYVKGRIREGVAGAPPPVRWLVFDAEAVSTIDTTGLDALGDVAAELRSHDIGLTIARAHPSLRRTLVASGLDVSLGLEIHATVGAAVAACAGGVHPRTDEDGPAG